MKCCGRKARRARDFWRTFARSGRSVRACGASRHSALRNIRTGIVLSPKGGALGAMLLPFKLGLGGRTGDGRQWMSWIDVSDMVGGIQHILKNDLLRGAVNMVAPKPVRNAEFAATLAGVLSRPAIFPMPGFVVRAGLRGDG